MKDLYADVSLFEGSGWMYYFVVIIQATINAGVSIGVILLAGDSIQVKYYWMFINWNEF